MDGLAGYSERGGDHLPAHAEVSGPAHERSLVTIEFPAQFADGVQGLERVLIARLCAQGVECVRHVSTVVDSFEYVNLG